MREPSFGDVDRIVTIKDGRAFEGEQMDPMEVAV